MTKFRPCIDLHQGLVKQVVGGSFDDSDNDQPIENFVSNKFLLCFLHMNDIYYACTKQ